MTMGVYYNRMLKQTFPDIKEARAYIEQERDDPNCDIRLFEIKFIRGT